MRLLLLLLPVMACWALEADTLERVERLALAASICEMEQDWSRAGGIWRHLLTLDPECETAASALWEIALQLRDEEFLLESGQWYSVHWPHSPERTADYLDFCYRSGRSARIDAALTQLPDSACMPLRVQMLLDRDRLREAGKLLGRYSSQPLERILGGYYSESYLWELVFDWGRRSESLTGALKLLRRFDNTENSASAQMTRARLFYLLEESKEGHKALERALELDPELIEAWLLLGRLHLYQKDYEQALAAYQKAAQLMPEDPEVMRYLAIALNYSGRKEEAGALHARLVAEYPAMQSLWVDYGTWLDRAGRFEKARVVYEKALDIFDDKALPALLNNLAFLLANQNTELERALELVTRALDTDPASASFLDTKGWVFFRMGRIPEARAYLEQAYRQMPESGEIQYHMGELELQAGKWELAREYWERALILEPGMEHIRLRLQELEEQDRTSCEE